MDASPAHMRPDRSFQGFILALQRFWAEQGCVILQPDGMEMAQFTYFQQVAGVECAPVAGELTYGLERLACYLQGVDQIMDLNFNGRDGDEKVSYRDVFFQAEQEYSRHNFEYADTAML